MTDERYPKERGELEAGWEWLKDHGPDNPHHRDFFDRWLVKLREYEQRYGMDFGADEKRSMFAEGLVAAVKAGRQKDSPLGGRKAESIMRGKRNATDQKR